MDRIQNIVRELRQWFGKDSIGYWIEVAVRLNKLSRSEAGYLVVLTEGKA